MIDLRHGDCLDVMRTLDADSIDACVCDPPYGICAKDVRNPKATGAGRDGTEGATRPWIEVALKNGFHEKPGKEPITDAAKQWQGWGTALKPSWEPVVLARKPISERTIAANVLRHGCGGLNIDACRVGEEVRVNNPGSTRPRNSMGNGWHDDARPTIATGRWPANLCWSVPEDEYLLRSNVTPEQKRELYRWLHENS